MVWAVGGLVFSGFEMRHKIRKRVFVPVILVVSTMKTNSYEQQAKEQTLDGENGAGSSS